MGRKNHLVTKRSLRSTDFGPDKRPRRVVQNKPVDDTVGLSRQEEQELNKALYASLNETRRTKSLPSLTGLENAEFLTNGSSNASSNSSSRSASVTEKPSTSKAETISLGKRRSLRGGPLPKRLFRSDSTGSSENDNLNVDESSQDSVKSSSSSANGSKRKIHAQRKFAQGCSLPGTPTSSPVKTSAAPVKLLSRTPKTEDFLTFLCLRGSSVLPPHLDFFNFSKEELPLRDDSPKGSLPCQCKQAWEATPDENSSTSSGGANEEVAATAARTPSSTGKGSSSHSRRSAARASAGALETARGIVSLRQGLQRKVSSSSSSSSSSPRNRRTSPSCLLTASCHTATNKSPCLHKPRYYFMPEKSGPSQASGILAGEFTPPSKMCRMGKHSPLIYRPSPSQLASPSSSSWSPTGSSPSFSPLVPVLTGASKRKRHSSSSFFSSDSSSCQVTHCIPSTMPSCLHSNPKSSGIAQERCFSPEAIVSIPLPPKPSSFNSSLTSSSLSSSISPSLFASSSSVCSASDPSLSTLCGCCSVQSQPSHFASFDEDSSSSSSSCLPHRYDVSCSVQKSPRHPATFSHSHPSGIHHLFCPSCSCCPSSSPCCVSNLRDDMIKTMPKKAYLCKCSISSSSQSDRRYNPKAVILHYADAVKTITPIRLSCSVSPLTCQSDSVANTCSTTNQPVSSSAFSNPPLTLMHDSVVCSSCMLHADQAFHSSSVALHECKKCRELTHTVNQSLINHGSPSRFVYYNHPNHISDCLICTESCKGHCTTDSSLLTFTQGRIDSGSRMLGRNRTRPQSVSGSCSDSLTVSSGRVRNTVVPPSPLVISYRTEECCTQPSFRMKRGLTKGKGKKSKYKGQSCCTYTCNTNYRERIPKMKIRMNRGVATIVKNINTTTTDHQLADYDGNCLQNITEYRKLRFVQEGVSDLEESINNNVQDVSEYEQLDFRGENFSRAEKSSCREKEGCFMFEKSKEETSATESLREITLNGSCGVLEDVAIGISRSATGQVNGLGGWNGNGEGEEFQNNGDGGSGGGYRVGNTDEGVGDDREDIEPEVRLERNVLNIFGDKDCGSSVSVSNKSSHHASTPSTKVIDWISKADTPEGKKTRKQTSNLSCKQSLCHVKLKTLDDKVCLVCPASPAVSSSNDDGENSTTPEIGDEGSHELSTVEHHLDGICNVSVKTEAAYSSCVAITNTLNTDITDHLLDDIIEIINKEEVLSENHTKQEVCELEREEVSMSRRCVDSSSSSCTASTAVPSYQSFKGASLQIPCLSQDDLRYEKSHTGYNDVTDTSAERSGKGVNGMKTSNMHPCVLDLSLSKIKTTHASIGCSLGSEKNVCIGKSAEPLNTDASPSSYMAKIRQEFPLKNGTAGFHGEDILYKKEIAVQKVHSKSEGNSKGKKLYVDFLDQGMIQCKMPEVKEKALENINSMSGPHLDSEPCSSHEEDKDKDKLSDTLQSPLSISIVSIKEGISGNPNRSLHDVKKEVLDLSSPQGTTGENFEETMGNKRQPYWRHSAYRELNPIKVEPWASEVWSCHCSSSPTLTENSGATMSTKSFPLDSELTPVERILLCKEYPDLKDMLPRPRQDQGVSEETNSSPESDQTEIQLKSEDTDKVDRNMDKSVLNTIMAELKVQIAELVKEIRDSRHDTV